MDVQQRDPAMSDDELAAEMRSLLAKPAALTTLRKMTTATRVPWPVPYRMRAPELT
jgi:hypothetical protein